VRSRRPAALLVVAALLLIVAAAPPAVGAPPSLPPATYIRFLSNLTMPTLAPGASGPVEFSVTDPLPLPLASVVLTLGVYAFNAYPGNATGPVPAGEAPQFTGSGAATSDSVSIPIGALPSGAVYSSPGSVGLSVAAPPGAPQSVLEKSANQGGQGGFAFQSQSLIEAKGFHAHDGASISLARLAGIKTGLITKRVSETVALRARDLKLEFVRQGIQDKATAFMAIVKEAGVAPDEAAFVGDDVIDLPAMRAGGLAIAVKNARAEVKKEAHYTTPHAGGEGALRDAVEFILKAQGKWKKIVEAYITERGPTVQ